jgi:hypothetical protein
MEDRLAALGMRNDIPPEVGALVMACLAKEPGQRPPSARALAEWIGLELDAKPTAESLAAALFPEGPAGPAAVAGQPAGKGCTRPAGYLRKLAAVGLVALALAGAFWLRKGIHRGDHANAPVAGNVVGRTEAGSELNAPPASGVTQPTRQQPTTRLTAEMLWNKRFRFRWAEPGSSGGNNGTATLQRDGTIAGIKSANETFWLIDDDGHLVFKHRDGRVSTIFTQAEQRDGKWFFSGPFQFNKKVQHLLEELPAPTT